MVQVGVDGGQGGDVDGQDLGIVLVAVHVQGQPDTAGLVGRQAEAVGEAVAGLAEQGGARGRAIGQRQQWMGSGGGFELVADPGRQALPPDVGRAGQQKDTHGNAGAVQGWLLQESAQVRCGPAFGVV
ncbi:hypothetical protein OG974_32520 (plasmid) [Streptomyces sp. NBC_00597]|uniref:hypothetical protein n=1 Tax=unclassified Streptomyces TaxID=2593676 RepID=UPI002E0F0F28|nr:hypothetical protein OG573_42525 [Streptomyces sp. NBC_01205]